MASGARREGEDFGVYRNRLKMTEKYTRKRLKLGPKFDEYLISELNKDKISGKDLDTPSGGVYTIR